MDDIRPYCQFGEMNVYADPLACKAMLQMLPYCFAEHRYPGVPAIGLHEIHAAQPMRIGDIEFLPVRRNVGYAYSRLQLNEADDHRDPSDHMIIAHAITERMALMSSDLKFPFYRNQGLELIEY
jgi:hypothetical protein